MNGLKEHLLNVAGSITTLVIGMLSGRTEHHSQAAPTATNILPDLPLLSSLHEIVVMHPDYLPIVAHISPALAPRLSRLSLRCSFASTVTPYASSIAKLSNLVRAHPCLLLLDFTIFGPRLSHDTAHLPILRSVCNVHDARMYASTDGGPVVTPV